MMMPVRAITNRGFTLIEILVAVLVLSIGLLAIATLQLKGLQLGKGSLQASQANAFASALADEMRANQSGAAAGDYTVSASNGAFASYAGKITPDTDCATVTCTPAQLAAYDLQRWIYGYNVAGPSGTVFVPGVSRALGAGATALVECQDTPCSSNSVIRIRVFWDQNRNSSTLPTKTDCADPNTGAQYSSLDPSELACVALSLQP